MLPPLSGNKNKIPYFLLLFTYSYLSLLVKILPLEKTQMKFGFLLTYSYLCNLNLKL